MTGRIDDWVLAGSVFWVLALLVAPLPPIGLDMMLSISLTLALLILLIALYTERPLDFSVFPTLLLIVTLLRLGLNVASTRLILVRGAEGSGAAGRVIQAFGDIAIGGNFLVGIILFLIFVVINFVVISKGSGRIAEVAARFTLDSMPGKQMAIDADLNQGILSESEARRMRAELQRETDFYGAMDGASKFVRGDAIAGLLIVGVNILGGLGVGVLQAGLPLGEALETYTALTVGDGLVGQVPALIVSTAAGIVVSRSAGGERLGSELRSQIFVQPRALFGTSALLGVLAMTPGLPFVPFAALAAGTGLLARWSATQEKEIEAEAERELAEATQETPVAPSPEEETRRALALDELELQIGYGLVPLVDAEKGGELAARIRAARKQLATELGFVIPLIHIRDNVDLDPSEYAVLLRGNRIGTSRVPPGRELAIQSGEEARPVPGIPTEDPAFGLPATWIQPRDRTAAEAAGYAVVDASAAVATHLAELVRANAAELLSRKQVLELLDSFSEEAPKVVEDIVPNLVPVSLLHRTLRDLLEEGVSIRDLGAILETLADYSGKVEDPALFTDLVRERLSRSVTRPYIASDGALHVLTLEPGLEEQLVAGVQRTASGAFLSVEPTLLERMLQSLQSVLATNPSDPQARGPVLLSTQNLRAPLRALLARAIPRLAVMSHGELPPEVRVVADGQVRTAHAH